ncbi:protein TIME FOR COFFEE-like, partial [Trifolium medium]|nr:protein TIME FOR COFFEE-like [Trifolium medium]
DDGAMEMQGPTRLRDRGSGKKDRDRERERERDRLGRNKRRGDRLMHGVREDGGEDTSEE